MKRSFQIFVFCLVLSLALAEVSGGGKSDKANANEVMKKPPTSAAAGGGDKNKKTDASKKEDGDMADAQKGPGHYGKRHGSCSDSDSDSDSSSDSSNSSSNSSSSGSSSDSSSDSGKSHSDHSDSDSDSSGSSSGRSSGSNSSDSSDNEIEPRRVRRVEKQGNTKRVLRCEEVDAEEEAPAKSPRPTRPAKKELKKEIHKKNRGQRTKVVRRCFLVQEDGTEKQVTVKKGDNKQAESAKPTA